MLNPAAPFRVALRERNIRVLLVGLAVSQAGDWLYNLALLAFLYDRTHSSTWIGLTTGARVVPLVLLGPLGGVLADRFHRRPLMMACDLARGATWQRWLSWRLFTRRSTSRPSWRRSAPPVARRIFHRYRPCCRGWQPWTSCRPPTLRASA
jgi:hypothetical protein